MALPKAPKIQLASTRRPKHVLQWYHQGEIYSQTINVAENESKDFLEDEEDSQRTTVNVFRFIHPDGHDKN